MADPPPTGRLSKPPPIPSRAPVAPAVARTEIAPPGDPGDTTGERDPVFEDTRSFDAPDAGQLVEHMLDLVASEAEALLEGDDADGRLADLNVRTALASWDGLHEPDEALRYLELAERHPLAPRLRISAALADGTPGALAAPQAVVDSLPPGAETCALALELAEAQLVRFGRADAAADLADRALGDPALPAAWRDHATDLAVLAHAAAGSWPRVVARCRAALDGAPPEEIAAAAALLLDRGADAAAAIDTCWAALAPDTSPGGTADTQPSVALGLGWLRLVDVALEAAWRAGDARRLELLARRADLVAGLAGGELEALATRHALAAELARAGRHADAAALWAELADDPAAGAPAAARRIATLGLAWQAAAAGKLADALAARRRLADPGCPEVSATHAWRAAELAAVLGDPALGDVARVVADATDSRVAERWLDLVEVPAPTAAMLARFEARGGLALRLAAACAERLGNVPRALELWRRAAASAERLGTEHDHVVRLLRASLAGPGLAGRSLAGRGERAGGHGPAVGAGDRAGGRGPAAGAGDEDALAEAYAEWARAEPSSRCGAALWCARGIVDLIRGDFVEAEDALRTAAQLDPGDPFCRAALAAVYRAGRRYDLLAQILDELATSLASGDARAAAAREYAELLDEHLGDPAGARAALERMLAERPSDGDAMLALARLHERDERWDAAIELRSRAALAAREPERRAALWVDVAHAEERRGGGAAALAALGRAAEACPTLAVVRREQIRLHRAAGAHEEALAIVTAELAADPPLARRMELLRDQAQLLTALGRDPADVVAAYLEVLAIEPDQTDALAGIEPPARELGMWDELARAFRGAPRTPHNLDVLAEALAKIADWAELAEVRRQQLEAARDTDEKARRAAELAALYEHELGDLDGAIRMLVIAHAAAPDEARYQDLLRLLRATGRWAELASALDRELRSTRPGQAPELALLVELGELRADRLERPAEAIAAFEAVLERAPDHPVASARLEELYAKVGRDRELARLLEARAGTTVDPVERAQLFARAGELRGKRGDTEGAIVAYTAAVTADPSSREVFTAMERVCYKAERWAAAMQLYDLAIASVESGGSRAYRLGDLYTRRGSVQLNFLGQIDAAIASFQKVIEVDSQPTAGVEVLERICRQRGNFAPLLAAWEQRADAQKDPKRKAEALRAAAALAEGDAKDPAAAMRIAKKRLALDPADSSAAARLERYYEDQRDSVGLIDVLKIRLSAPGADRVALHRKIATASEEGARDVETATEHYRKILELEPENREALEALGRIYESTEQWAELVDITRRQIKVTTDRNLKALLYFKCGSVMEAKFGREHDAIRYYDAAIKTSPSCLPAVHGLRDLYRRREEWRRVIETLELEVKLWDEDKERAGVFAQIGRIYELQLADPERAMQFYDSALAVDPDCLPANQALFEFHVARQDWDKAAPLANALAQKAMREGDPTTRSEFYRKRGVVARMTGDPKAAADSLVVALELRPTNAAALDDLGALAREQPDVWDFEATYKELEKVFKKRDDGGPLLARVHVGRAVLAARAGDLDAAAALYRQALELAPTELAILSALVDFHADMRRWSDAIEAIQQFVDGGAAPADRIAALMRQAMLHADGEMDASRAIAVLRHVLQLEAAHQDAHYQLAQQYFLIGRHAEARAAIDRVIELATAPGQPLIPEALARYYYYKGRILEVSGDSRGAAPQYRRASEYDPGYAPPALVLARRAADSGDQRQAETLLIEAAHAAMARGGPRAAVPLQRGLARILLSSGDRPAAIEAYRGILNVEPDGASDRVALAEIYAIDDPQRAIGELRKVLDRDIHHAPAYRLLASFYSRTGDTERALRVLTVLDLLGFAEDADRQTMTRLRSQRRIEPARHGLDDASRDRLLVTPAARGPLGEVWSALAAELSGVIAPPSLGEQLAPAEATGDDRLVRLVREAAALHGVEADVFVGDRVPGLFAVTAFPRRLLVIDRSLLAEAEPPLRYLLGYAFDAIRGGYAALVQLGARAARELGQLLRALLAGGEPTGHAAAILEAATPRASKLLQRLAGTREIDPGAWIDGMLACAKRAGLLACDDFAAAIWMIARLSGEVLVRESDAAALGAVLGGADLVNFYLSDNYQQLRDALAAPGIDGAA